MQKASEVVGKYQNIGLFGPSKSAGKTTFALSVVPEGPQLLLQYSTGTVTVPPGVDPDQIYVESYTDDMDVMKADTDKWKRNKEAGVKVFSDFLEIERAFAEKRPIKLGGVEAPLPRSLILDDVTFLNDYVVSWICAVNNIADPENWKQWGKRTQVLMSFLRRAVRLPCNTIFTAWETVDKDENGKALAKWPDVGGRLDFRAIGLVDASLYCYSRKEAAGTRFYVKTKSDGLVQGCGVRNRYDLKDEVDVTIVDGKGPLPFERIFGKS